MIEVKNLKFHYGMSKSFGIDDVSLKLESGLVSCLLGKNGAGKTTLMSLAYGMLRPKSGEILWNGEKLSDRNLAAFRREVAFSGEAWCPGCMTVEQGMEAFSILYPTFDIKYFDKLMELASVEQLKKKYFGLLSKGERVKTEIAFLLARKPKFLFMDEPLANVDPVFKVDILELLQQGVAENETGILISTHLVDEISDMVDQVYVMDQGKMIMQGDRFEVLGDGEESLRDLFKKA
ncbi:MAG: ABC transporter ATP-binding protein [Lachnospiraceae bacterium]|nr:ABC transporter ATP-binding protein [Lachnospiraceae bacterium]